MFVKSYVRYTQQRRYSDLLRGLPRVGVSRFGKPAPKQDPANSSEAPSKSSQAKSPTRPQSSPLKSVEGGNRFAKLYSKHDNRNKSNQNQASRANTKSNAQSTQKSSNQRQFEKQNQKQGVNKPAKKQVQSPSSDSSTKTAQAQQEAYEKAKAALNLKMNSNKNYANDEKKSKTKQKKIQKREKEPILINIPLFVTVANLSSILNIPLPKFLVKLQDLGFEEMRHNYILDKENASLIAGEFGFEVNMNDDVGADIFPAPLDEAKLKPRAPIVTIMGHVDHGKTTILDFLRKSSIVAKEHGGITQHIGAFSVITPISKKKITFLDTPGHAAFLKMRERGATVTDIVILVVAADDSVMPQTIEAIKHAKKSGVPIIVAINKCDKSTANPDKVVADIASHGIEVEDYGGDTQTVRISGKTGLNMDQLEEAVITISELSELQAEVNIPGEGWILESHMQKGLGNVATILVKRGTLKTGDIIIAGSSICKIRGMKDENGKSIKQAGPSTPVSIWGWKDLPEAGEQVLSAKNEQLAKKVSENRISRSKQIQAAQDIEVINAKRKQEEQLLAKQEKLAELNRLGLSEAAEKLEKGPKEPDVINFIIKSDVYGSAEAIKESIDGLGNNEITSKVIFQEAGLPTDSDLDRAQAADAKILCFNIKVPKDILNKADKLKIDIIEHNVIYHLIEDVTKILTSKLEPIIEQKIISEASIRDVFTITGKNKIKFKIAGCKVNNGNIKRQSLIRVDRKEKVVYTGKLSSLKHLKDDVQEVKNGAECGLAFENWDDFQPGDVVKVYEEVVQPRYL